MYKTSLAFQKFTRRNLVLSSCRLGFNKKTPVSTSFSILDHKNNAQIPTVLPNACFFSSLPNLIQQLRKDTGAPMMECKKALSATENDYEKAIEWLRKNGTAKAASKLVGREASEGMVGIAYHDQGMSASIVKVASETDFASRSKDFTSLVEIVANGALSCESDALEDLLKVRVVKVDGENTSEDGNHRTIKDAMDDSVLSIRENLQIANVEKIVAKDKESVLAGYVHGKVFQESNAGTAAALVELNKSSSNKGKPCTLSRDEMEQVGKRLAMHIVAAKPVYLAPENVPEHEIEKEKQILMEQMADSGKSADILEKIVNGRMRKYYEQVCLLEQSHMLEEGNPKVSKLLAQLGLDLVTYKLCFVQK